MSLIVEDGTGLAGAESYASVSDADAWHSNRGNTLWATMTTTEKEQALRRATDYMVQVYRMLWVGVRHLDAQALDWPRDWVPYTKDGVTYDPETVPVEVKNACAEMAFRAASGELAPDIDRVTKREKLGPLEVEYEPGLPYKRYRAIDNMLAIWLKTGVSSAFRALERV